MWKGIEQVKPGATLGDIGYAIQSFSEKKTFTPKVGSLRRLTIIFLQNIIFFLHFFIIGFVLASKIPVSIGS